MTPTAAAPDAALETHLAETRERRLDEFRAFLRIPSISALPAHKADVHRAAEWLAERGQAAGLEHVEVAETGGHPIFYADWLHADGAPTVVAYAHYDVQPVDPLDEWLSPPFEPRIDGDRIYARGASDDKSNATILLHAVESVLATRGGLPVNLRLVFEGEEESGSRSLVPWLKANRERLGGDVAHISDSGMWEGEHPLITVGLRGLVAVEVTVTGAPHDLHSGAYGGLVQNPLNALAGIVAGLKGPDGRIRVPGFYDDVVPLTDADREAIAGWPFDEERYRQQLEVPTLVGEVGYTALERRSSRPTLDLNGIWGGFQGDGSKTIIPARAHAKISCRLVPDQDPATILERLTAFITEIAPPGVTVDVRPLGMGRPTRVPMDHPATQAAARAFEAVWGEPPLYVREGGSIPFVAEFEAALGIPLVLFGFTPAAANFHAPNEWMDLRYMEPGIRTIARFWDELAAGG
jgi:acetylornithine deacetylase/succinyl-diaminopimelate desuccinylase-like protein